MSKWTPEPWRVTAYEGGWTGIGSQRDGLLFKAAYNNKANAERAVDCVNGCIGIDDPETTVPELVAACKQIRAAMYHFELSAGLTRIGAVLTKTGKREPEAR